MSNQTTISLLECEDKPELIALYERHYFKAINISNNQNDLITMYFVPKFSDE